MWPSLTWPDCTWPGLVWPELKWPALAWPILNLPGLTWHVQTRSEQDFNISAEIYQSVSRQVRKWGSGLWGPQPGALAKYISDTSRLLKWNMEYLLRVVVWIIWFQSTLLPEKDIPIFHECKLLYLYYTMTKDLTGSRSADLAGRGGEGRRQISFPICFCCHNTLQQWITKFCIK